MNTKNKPTQPAPANRRGSIYHAKSMLASDASDRAQLIGAMAATALFLIGAVIWASVTTINTSVTIHGEIIPFQELRAITSSLNGTIQSIDVKTQQHVNAGDKLAVFDSTATLDSLKQKSAYLLELKLKRQWLKAFLNDENINRSELIERVIHNNQLSQTMVRSLQALVESTSYLSREWRLHIEKLKGLLTNRQRLQGEYHRLSKQNVMIGGQIQLLQKERKDRRHDAFIDKQPSTYTLLEDEYLKLREQWRSAKQRIRRIQHELTGVKKQVKLLRNTLKRKATVAIDNTTTLLSKTLHEQSELEKQLKAHAIYAPVNGIVRKIWVTQGERVITNKRLFDIFPDNPALVVEAMIAGDRIQGIKTQAQAFITIREPSESHPKVIQGHVLSITKNKPDNTSTQQPYYKAIVAIDKTYSVNADANRLQPGMNAEADITIGQSSVLDYWLKKFYGLSKQ